MIHPYQWRRSQRVRDWMLPHSSSLGSAGPGALADVAGDPLAWCGLRTSNFGNRGLDGRVRGALVVQQDAMVGAVQQVAGVGQAAVSRTAASSSPMLMVHLATAVKRPLIRPVPSCMP
jgi:hypothetical protein